LAPSRQIKGVYLIFLAALTFTSAQVARAERPAVRIYTTADGLAHNRISSIARDSRGFLWFCTADGLSRFDGSRFTNYNVEDGLPSTSINYVLETRKGVYWIATNGGGAARLNSSTGARSFSQAQSQPRFTVYKMSNDAVANRVNILFEDSAGVLWAGTDGGLLSMDESKGEREFHAVELKIPSRSDLSVQVWAFVETSDRSLWIGTKFGLVHRLPTGQMIHYQIQPGTTDTVWSVLKDPQGNLWLAHDSGVIVFNPKPESGSHTEPGRSLKLEPDRRYAGGRGGAHVRILFQSSSGRIWASETGHGLNLFDGKDFQPYPIGESLDLAGPIAEDRDGNLWVGTNSGVMRIALQGFTTYDAADGLGSAVSSVFEGNSGELYVSGKWQVSRLDGNKFVTVKFNLPKSVTELFWRPTGNLVLQDSVGEWWVGTRAGLYRFAKVSRIEQLASAQPKAVYTTREGLADDDLTRLFEDSRGDIWIAGFSTVHDVVTRWERATESFHRYSEADGLRSFTRPNSFCEDRAGNLWIAFDEGGLARYSGGRFTLLTENAGVPPGSIMSLYLDKPGRLWFSHPLSGALYRIDNPEASQPGFVAYTKDQGLGAHRLFLITGDKDGGIYVTHSRGIDRLDPVTEHVKHYTSSDGLGTGQLIGAFGDRQGNMWFATTKGLLRLVPRSDRELPPPTVLIDSLRIAGNVYHLSELGEKEIVGLEMEPNQNQISIDFFALSFGSGESLRYQYKLEGSYADWSAPGEQRSVNYPNLAPGAYRFLVRAIGANGAIGEIPAVVSFRILPPVWRRWWFLALAATLISSVVFAFARSRIARLREARESDRRFRTLAETASDAIITIDADSHIVLVNQAAERIFGYSTSEMLGKELTMLMPEYLRHLHRAGLAHYRDTGKRHISWQAVELPGLHKNGKEIPLELSFGEFTKNDRRFFTGIARDITERKKAEQERKEAEDALRRSREERLAELERVRRRIATDLHDDIGSSLTQISLLSEVMRRRVDGEGSPLSEPLSKIGRASRELVDAMSDIVWAINPQKDHLSDLTLRMRRFASDVFTARNIKFSLREPDEEEDIRLGANIRREVFLIFKESINNLVRHSGCTEATINFQITDGRLALEVRDNGKGFDTSEDREGHGLMSMRARAKDIGGKLEIISDVESGTTVSLEVLLERGV
jgi:PAS domain S-box-containing protein